MTYRSRFFADDKDIFDLLVSSKRRPSDDRLRELARARGIILGTDLPRENLAQYLSRLPYSHPQLTDLLAETASSARPKKTTNEEVGVSVEDIKKAAEATREARQDNRQEVYKVVQRANGGLDISILYTYLDEAKTKLRQRREAECQIEVEKTNDGVLVRYPDDPRASEIADSIISGALGEDPDQIRKAIRLNEALSTDERTRFFVQLMSGIEGFVLGNVTRAGFGKVNGSLSNDLDDEQDVDDLAEENPIRGLVEKIVLSGAGVLESKEYQLVKKEGFFLNGSVWRAQEDNAKGIEAEFEAAFSSASDSAQLTYRVRGVFRRGADGDVNKTKVAPTESERKDLTRRLERAAKLALQSVEETLPEEGDNTDTGEGS